VTWPGALIVTETTPPPEASWNVPAASVRAEPDEDSMIAPATGARLTVATTTPVAIDPTAEPGDALGAVGEFEGESRQAETKIDRKIAIRLDVTPPFYAEVLDVVDALPYAPETPPRNLSTNEGIP
jgi:hypothetical protein